MADESVDMDDVEGGGYMDDEIELGDNDMPTSLQTPHAKADIADDADQMSDEDKPLAETMNGAGARGKAKSGAGPGKGSDKPPPRDPRDYDLRVCGDKEREMIVARFLNKCPSLEPPTRMRALRDGEENLDARKEAIVADRRQYMRNNSHLGRKKREVRERQGYIDIPDRDRKRWKLDVYAPEDGTGKSGALDTAQDPSAEGVETPSGADVYSAECSHSREFQGTFEGKSSSRYAVLVVNEHTHSADIVPIGPYAWFSFRQKRGKRLQHFRASTEDAEARMDRKAKLGSAKLAKFQEKSAQIQSKVEQELGSMAAVRAVDENAFFTNRVRGAATARYSDSKREDLDFDQEFDDDDVAQMDKEQADHEEEANAVRADAEVTKRKLRKLIKDEDTPDGTRPGSPGSDSDDEDDARSQENQELKKLLETAGRKSSPTATSSKSSSPLGRARSPGRSPTHGGASAGLPPKAPHMRGNAAGSATRVTTDRKASRPGSSRRSTPSRQSPGSSATPGTPLRQEIAHLLPPSGTLPTAKHVTDVLSALLRLRNSSKVPLKELTRLFERNTSEQKENLVRIVRQIAQVTEADPPGSKIYEVSLK